MFGCCVGGGGDEGFGVDVFLRVELVVLLIEFWGWGGFIMSFDLVVLGVGMLDCGVEMLWGVWICCVGVCCLFIIGFLIFGIVFWVMGDWFELICGEFVVVLCLLDVLCICFSVVVLIIGLEGIGFWGGGLVGLGDVWGSFEVGVLDDFIFVVFGGDFWLFVVVGGMIFLFFVGLFEFFWEGVWCIGMLFLLVFGFLFLFGFVG